MNRRNFLSLLGIGIAGVALDRAIPFGRVWSFPKEIIVPWFEPLNSPSESEFRKAFRVGSTIRVRIPQRFIIREYIGDFRGQQPQYGTFAVTPEGLEPTPLFHLELRQSPS
jgi:hypothetical protein